MDRIEELVRRDASLSCVAGEVRVACEVVVACYRGGGTVYVAGNGGSAADASHLVGELMKGFVKRRPVPREDALALSGMPDGAYLSERLQCGLRAMSLMSQEGITTAVQNDLGGDLGPAQQLYALGRRGDVLIGLSTSGNARNVALACQVAKLRGMSVIGLTGRGGGLLKSLSDVCVCVPETETFKVQELHLPVYHTLCLQVEETFFPA